jgi:hypothetical protein
MVKIKARRGQFLVLTAFLVVVVLSSAIVLSYKRIQENQNIEPVVISSKLVDLHNSLNEMLSFTVGYYGSLIQVTGDLAYAQEKTQAYLESGLQSISRSNIDWGTSFNLTTPPSPLKNPNIHTDWFVKSSKTEGDITIKYDIPSLGLKGVEFKTYVALNVEILETSGGNAKVKITKDYDRIDLSLLRSNFRFFKYASNQWDYKDLESDPTITTSGEYLVPIPAGIYANAYNLQVVDNRGLMVAAGYVKGEGFENKPTTSYEFSFKWPNEHDSLSNDTPIVVELHQDGSLWWMGENILPFSEKPIPPVPVKGIHVNGTNQLNVTAEVPFQVEDWGSNYQVPYGIASANTIFNENCMIVFLVNHNVKNVTIWWDGRDNATQPITATKNLYFTDQPDWDPISLVSRRLSNGIITLDFRLGDDGHSSGDHIQASTATGSYVNTTTRYLRINDENPIYGAPESYIIYNGIVRDIIQQEPEYPQRTLPFFSPSSNTAGTGGPWTTPVYAYANDALRATAAANGLQQIYHGYNIALNSGNKVTRVRVRLDAFCSSVNQYIKLEVSTDGGVSWLATPYTTPNLPSSEATYWVDVTGWTTWNPIMVNGNNLQVRVTSVRTAGTIYLDWVPVEVTYSACPDLYTHLVITLPAKANYYTYKLRTIFLETTLTRNINNLQILSLAVNSANPVAGTQYTEDDIDGGLPGVSTGTLITDGDPLDYAPHWSEFRDVSNNCVGTFFTNTNNDQLFYFNTPTRNTGAIEIASKNIYLRPVRSTLPVNGLQSATDLTWNGAIAVSGTGQGRNTVYYPGSSPTGLWILVEKLPTITVK